MRFDARGTAMVEFVLVLPFFLLLLFTMIYMAMIMHDYTTVNQLTREAARYGAVMTIEASDEKAIQLEINQKMTAYLTPKKDLLTQLYELDVKPESQIEKNDSTQTKSISVKLWAKVNPSEFPVIVQGLATLFPKLEGRVQMRREWQ